MKESDPIRPPPLRETTSGETTTTFIFTFAVIAVVDVARAAVTYVSGAVAEVYALANATRVDEITRSRDVFSSSSSDWSFH